MTAQRLTAVWEAFLPEVREYAGLHRFDGRLQDLSPAGVAAMLARVGDGPRLGDRHDEAHLSAAEADVRTRYGRAEVHRWNPLPHLSNLDLACYDREYAPPEERAKARSTHLDGWPDAVAGSLASLDLVTAPVAKALVGAVKGLALYAGGHPQALEAQGRLVAHLERAIDAGAPHEPLGSSLLGSMLAAAEGMPVDLARLESRADAERDRLRGLLNEACGRLRPGAAPAALMRELSADHPDAVGIYSRASELIDEVTAFTVEHRLLPPLGGSCMVGPSPPSRSWGTAMMSWAAPGEPEAPAWFYVNPPDPGWPAEEQEQWLATFSDTTLPAITAHEVTPGHFAHGQMLARAKGEVRRTLFSEAFVEGWAHYGEELLVEEGFRSSDPRFAIGVYVEALVRVTRLAVALGVHGGSMSLDEARRRFEQDAFLEGPAAVSEAERSLYDPTYGRYTWGKLEIMALRDEAMALWGTRYNHLRFHEALLSLGSPPLGTMGDVLSD